MQNLPVLFEAANGQDAIRAGQLANEFGFKLYVDASGEEYRHIDAFSEGKTAFILPLNFPEAFDLTDVQASRAIPLSALMHWESAVANAALLHRKGFTFALTSRGISDEQTFFTNLRRLVAAGLPANAVLPALTTVPANFLGVESRCGLLKAGYDASFIVCSDSLLHPGNVILENWALGQRLKFDKANQLNINGVYRGMAGKD
jgi:imidazolonepropionase-like amidohydrolase